MEENQQKQQDFAKTGTDTEAGHFHIYQTTNYTFTYFYIDKEKVYLLMFNKRSNITMGKLDQHKLKKITNCPSDWMKKFVILNIKSIANGIGIENGPSPA